MLPLYIALMMCKLEGDACTMQQDAALQGTSPAGQQSGRAGAGQQPVPLQQGRLAGGLPAHLPQPPHGLAAGRRMSGQTMRLPVPTPPSEAVTQ